MERKVLTSSLKGVNLETKERALLESVVPPFNEEQKVVYESVGDKVVKNNTMQWIEPEISNLNELNTMIRLTLEKEYSLPAGELSKPVVEHPYEIDSAKEGAKAGRVVPGDMLLDFEAVKRNELYSAEELQNLPYMLTPDSIIVSKKAVKNLGNMGRALFYWANLFSTFGVVDAAKIYRGYSTEELLRENDEDSCILPPDVVSYVEALGQWESLVIAPKLEGLPGMRGFNTFMHNCTHVEYYSMKYAKTIPMGIVMALRDLELKHRSNIDSVHYSFSLPVEGGGFLSPYHNAIFWSDRDFENRRKSAQLVASLLGGTLEKLENPEDYDKRIFKKLEKDIEDKQMVATPNLR
ncbi:hypothetical protein EPN87_00300 [archaeon]|nr:MAG: hypothetical protein EPN87_00300 [archaeon]